MFNVALDVMGGDHAPDINIDGAYDALGKIQDLNIILLGPEKLIKEKISSWDNKRSSHIEIIDAPLVITNEESPVQALLKKKNSSIAVGANMLRSGEAQAFLSAGSSGALLAAGQLIVGRIKGVERTPLTAMIPTLKGFSLFLDCGANVDAKPLWLCQFARMGTIYMEKVQNRPKPIVKLINLGVEEDKGNELTKETHALLKETKDINYQGFMEARDVMSGEADIIITDAFTGNAIIKTIEGTTRVFMKVLKDELKSSPLTSFGGLLIMNPLKKKMKSFDASECGGAVLLGLNGLIVKCHGNSSREDIRIALEKIVVYLNKDVNKDLREAFK